MFYSYLVQIIYYTFHLDTIRIKHSGQFDTSKLLYHSLLYLLLVTIPIGYHQTLELLTGLRGTECKVRIEFWS